MKKKTKETKRVLIICTSGKDRSPTLAAYLRDNYPQHTFKSAGINAYFCHKHGTNLLTQKDIDSADVLVFCEDIHLKVARERYDYIGEAGHARPIDGVVLNCGQYFPKTPMADDWITKAHEKLRGLLE